MKKSLLVLLCGVSIASAQTTTLFTENFNGSTAAFTLNSSDQSSTTSGYNSWVINNSYNGGSYTDNNCTGFSVNISATASQPGGITGAPNSKYLHIVSNDAMSQGISNANFLASDGGAFCVGDENYFAKMTSDVSTIGMDTVKISFYWLCSGSTANYGELYYSTDGGNSWFLQQSNFRNQASWTQAVITNSLWNNQGTLRFGFRFVNGFSFSASDPPFAVDELIVTGHTPSPNTVTTGALSSSTLCAGASLQVPYLAAGTYNAGNIFTAQLSDASGNFSAPATIGTLSSTTSGTINCILPAGLTSGSGYLVRVVSSNPSTTGSVSSTTLTVNALPSAIANNNGPLCAGQPLALIGSGGTLYNWVGPNSFNSAQQNPTIASASTTDSGTYTLTVTDANGCMDTATTTVTVNSCMGIDENNANTISVYPNPATDQVIISMESVIDGKTELVIYDLYGRQIIHRIMNTSIYTIDIKNEGLLSGTYFVAIKNSQRHIVKKLIIE